MPRICGWSFQADIFCDDCMKPLAAAHALKLGDAASYTSESAETAVRAWALAEGRAFDDIHDTNDFPMPILTGTEDSNGRCSQVGCGEELADT